MLVWHVLYSASVVGGGYYMYIEASSPRKAGEKAALVSKVLEQPRQIGCKMTFWYHMYGTSIADLDVRLVYSTTHNYSALTITGNQGNIWQQASILIPVAPVPNYQVHSFFHVASFC